jgi:hypothetical protein
VKKLRKTESYQTGDTAFKKAEEARVRAETEAML